MYFKPKGINEMSPTMKCVLMTVTIMFTILSIILLPVDISTIKMSMVPSFNTFTILVIIVISVKFLCLLDWYLMLCTTSIPNIIHGIAQICGSIFVGGAFVVTVAEICIVLIDLKWYQIILAMLMHPFIIDLGFFMICNVLSHIAIWFKASNTEYTMIPQMPMSYPMTLINAPELITQMPSQPVPPTVYQNEQIVPMSRFPIQKHQILLPYARLN